MISEAQVEPWSPQQQEAELPGNKRFTKPHWTAAELQIALARGPNSELPEALYNDFNSFEVIQKEKPVHRRMIELSIQGFNNREIATAVGYSESMVGEVLRQPWARARIIESAKRNVSEELKEYLETTVMERVRRIDRLAADATAPANVRLAADNSLLDRFLGKPNQPITTASAEPAKLTNEELERRVASIVAGIPASTEDS